MSAHSRGFSRRPSHIWLLVAAQFILGGGFLGLVAAVQAPSNGQIPILPPHIPTPGQDSLTGSHKFSLRHIYHRGTYEHPDLHVKLDVTPETRLSLVDEETGLLGPVLQPIQPLLALSNPVSIQRLADRRPSVIESHLSYARSSGAAVVLSPSDWVTEDIAGPNVKDKETVLTFARMTANDYIEEPGAGEWEDISGHFNHSLSFGWQGDGLRGHIYADEGNKTIVISLKGTSPALFDGAGTTTNDKINDNLYFSCCCGQGGSYLWRQVCDCYTSAYTANLTCITEALLDENRYYRAAIDLYTNVTKIYPDSDIWLTGHSLGGGMTSLLGMTFGLPVVTFEAVPEALPAARLGLPAPPGTDPRRPQSRENTAIYHFGHTADPVYMGTCNGASSVCTWGGYAMESACHAGSMCVYDTVEDKGWRVGIGTHRIKAVISDVLLTYENVAPCAPEEECFDCELWKFFKSNGSDSTTTATTSLPTTTITTRTSTCKTPGWWGCLDETTTATTTTTSTTTTETTTTCKTPGWFGCLDETTTITTATSPYPSSSPTGTAPSTTCETPGWFGCKDASTTAASYHPTPAPSITRLPSPTTSTVQSTVHCRNPGWFGCRDHSKSSPHFGTSTSTFSSSTCQTPGHIWGCRDRPTSGGNTQMVTPRP